MRIWDRVPFETCLCDLPRQCFPGSSPSGLILHGKEDETGCAVFLLHPSGLEEHSLVTNEAPVSW